MLKRRVITGWRQVQPPKRGSFAARPQDKALADKPIVERVAETEGGILPKAGK